MKESAERIVRTSGLVYVLYRVDGVNRLARRWFSSVLRPTFMHGDLKFFWPGIWPNLRNRTFMHPGSDKSCAPFEFFKRSGFRVLGNLIRMNPRIGISGGYPDTVSDLKTDFEENKLSIFLNSPHVHAAHA